MREIASPYSCCIVYLHGSWEKKQIEKKDKKVSSFIFNTYFDRESVNVASGNCTYSILIISEINRNRMCQRNFSDKRRDAIPCVIILWFTQEM